MSWSVNLIGKPAKIVEALEARSEQISKNPDDLCRIEYDAAKPHLIGLVQQNFVKPGTSYVESVLVLEASGHGSRASGEDVQRSCRVKLESLNGTLVT